MVKLPVKSDREERKVPIRTKQGICYLGKIEEAREINWRLQDQAHQLRFPSTKAYLEAISLLPAEKIKSILN